MPEWTGRLSQNPDLINDFKTNFEFFVESGSRTFRIPFNTPLAIVYADPKFVANKEDIGSDKMIGLKVAPKTPDNVIYVRDARDLENTYNFLTGIGGGTVARQTNSFGIVPFDPEDAVAKSFDDMALIDDLLSTDPIIAEAAKQKLVEAKIANMKRLKDVQKKLIQASEARIKDALRLTYNNLIRQWQRNDEANVARYAPSISERMAYMILDPEIKASDNEAAASAKIANEMMNRKVVG